jgi:nicotinamide-nucleotide amidase
MKAKAEILSIGSELTSGQNLDTNSSWLSRRLGEIGISVGWHTTIADDLEDNVAAFHLASQRAGFVLSTGGLGPTQDDLTRQVLARLAGVELVLHQESLDQIQQMFAARSRVMPERNRVQALFPAGAEPLPNIQGTAPGIWMRMEDCCLAALPGVPSEMMAMFETQVLPRLQTLGLAGGVRLQRKINCFGAGESAVEKKLLDLTGRGQVPEVGITVSDATISLRILASAPTPRAAQQVIAPVERTICERLGDLVFGFDDEELQQVVLRLLGQKRLTLATAEGVTAGLLAHRLAGVPGASLWFRGGLVVYDNQLKVEFLGVPPRLLEEHGTVSGLVAEAMAIGCRTRFRTDLAVSTVGLAGPEGAGVHKPIGLVYVGLAWAGGVVSQSWNWGGTRTEIQSRTAKLAHNRLRIHLMRTSSDQ